MIHQLRAARLAVILAIVCSSGIAKADLSGVVVGVLDGDTIDVLVDRAPVRVRLAQIDAPEKAQPFGTRARQALSSAVYRKTITVTSTTTDRYGRTVGTVHVDGRNINRELIAAGMAWAYRQYIVDADLVAVEAIAREARIGLWIDPRPIPPWDWRRRKRDDSIR